MLSPRICHHRVSEITLYTGGSFDQHSHEGPGFMFEIKLGERKSAGMNPGLQIAVQVFIRIHFRRIGGEIEDGYCFLMVCKPFSYLLAVMSFEVVEDEIDLPSRIVNQPSHEGNEFLLGHRFPVDHEPDLPLIRDCGNHTDMSPLCRHSEHRRLSFWTIAADHVRLVLYTRFIAPVDLGLLFFGHGGDFGVLSVEPLLNRFRVLLLRSFDRLLGSESPAFQIFPHCSYRHIEGALSVDDFPNRLPCPERERELELVRGLVDNELLDVSFLFFRQGSLLPVATSSSSEGNLLLSSLPVLLPQGAGVLRAYSEKLRHILILLALFPQADHLIPDGLLNFVLQFASIDLFHGGSIA